jgi:pimeloyl-ACP methyl ester carboxylesterase
LTEDTTPRGAGRHHADAPHLERLGWDMTFATGHLGPFTLTEAWSCGHALDELIEDFVHLGARSHPVCCFGDVQARQILLGADTSRIGAVVLTDCDAFRTFPPRAFAPLFQALRHPGLVAWLVPGLRLEKVRHGPLAYGPLSSGSLDRGLTRDWIQPLAGKDIRRDLAKFARGVDPRVLLDAASRFSQFTGPVRILWGEDDPFFRAELGKQLSDAFPNATLSTVPRGRTFLPLDHPGEVASEITAAVRHAARRGG